MADTKATAGGCNERCGCPSPCPGGQVCKCVSSETSSGGDPNMVHKRCSCGDHCDCNPCGCSKTPVAGVGKAFCKCGEGCECISCAS